MAQTPSRGPRLRAQTAEPGHGWETGSSAATRGVAPELVAACAAALHILDIPEALEAPPLETEALPLPTSRPSNTSVFVLLTERMTSDEESESELKSELALDDDEEGLPERRLKIEHCLSRGLCPRPRAPSAAKDLPVPVREEDAPGASVSLRGRPPATESLMMFETTWTAMCSAGNTFLGSRPMPGTSPTQLPAANTRPPSATEEPAPSSSRTTCKASLTCTQPAGVLTSAGRKSA
mmetsp:Transcript_62391/g.162150  ORF Transcript_62391/g.162150 Transcript_62391/m.162150 type:complete len:237 (+) Transcript_62391:116-826(+)